MMSIIRDFSQMHPNLQTTFIDIIRYITDLSHGRLGSLADHSTDNHERILNALYELSARLDSLIAELDTDGSFREAHANSMAQGIRDAIREELGE